MKKFLLHKVEESERYKALRDFYIQEGKSHCEASIRASNEIKMFPCSYCDEPMVYWQATRDHVIPKKLGGGKLKDNVVISCKECNNLKGHKTLAEWLKYLQRTINLIHHTGKNKNKLTYYSVLVRNVRALIKKEKEFLALSNYEPKA